MTRAAFGSFAFYFLVEGRQVYGDAAELATEVVSAGAAVEVGGERFSWDGKIKHGVCQTILVDRQFSAFLVFSAPGNGIIGWVGWRRVARHAHSGRHPA